jgi:hypothetical protein
VSLCGYFNDRVADGVLDDIYVKSLVLESETESAALFVFDLAYVETEFVQRVRGALSTEYGLRGDMTTFTATHTHTAPEICAGGHVPVSSAYIDFLYEKTLEAYRRALANVQPCQVRFHLGRNGELAFNRRYWMKSGEVVTNPGKLNPDILKPEGPIDRDVGVAGLFAGEKLTTVLINIVNHSDTIGGTRVSADWPGHLSRLVKKKVGKDIPVLVMIGTAGNINHFDVTTDRNQTCYEESQRVGEGYAKTVLDSLARCLPVESTPLRTARIHFEVPPREISDEEIRQARKETAFEGKETSDGNLTSEGLAAGDPSILKFFALRLLKLAEDCSPRKLEVQGIRFGDLVILSVPGEPFVEVGLELKKYSRARYTFIAEVANVSSSGYIPLGVNFSRGGYETAPMSSPNSIKTATILIQKAKELLDKLSV